MNTKYTDRNTIDDLNIMDFATQSMLLKIELITENKEIDYHKYQNEFSEINAWFKKLCNYKYKDYNAEYIHYQLVSRTLIINYLIDKNSEKRTGVKFIINRAGCSPYEIKIVH